MIVELKAEERNRPAQLQHFDQEATLRARARIVLQRFNPLPARPRVPSANQLWGWSLLSLLTGATFLWLSYRWGLRPLWPNALPGFLRELILISEIGSLFTLGSVWAVLLWRHQRPVQRSSAAVISALSIDEMYALSPGAFEAYVAELFRHKGYQVTLRGGSGDHGVDLEIINETGRKAIVQCKRYRSTVGEETIRELLGTMLHESAAHGFLVTTAEISEAARDWALDKPMTLIDGNLLAQIAASLAAKAAKTHEQA